MGVIGKNVGRVVRGLAITGWAVVMVVLLFHVGGVQTDPIVPTLWLIWGTSWLYWATQATSWSFTPNRHQQPAR